jgi:hypothetical protein
VSRAAGEALYGTASRVRGWVLLEQPGPWGREALLQSRLDPDLGRALRAAAHAAGVRLLLLRRPGRDAGGTTRRCFVAHSGRAVRWLQERQLDDPAELLDLDLEAVRTGRRPAFGEPSAEPLYLVCTNGRHDRCCATWGRPLVGALAGAGAGRVWECSHVGGDRFAGNLVCLPHGVYYGRVGPDDGRRVLAAHQRGLLDLEHYRGRSCDPPAVQAAEWFARRRLRLDRLDDLVARSQRAEPDGLVTVGFDGPAGPVRVRLRVAPAATPRPITCDASELRAPPTYTLVDLAA